MIFRAKFRDALKQEAPELFAQIPNNVWFKKWIIHCKAAGNGNNVLKYFAPYIFRVAISNNRIIKLENDCVTFRYKDSKTGKWRTMTLNALEFMRRFLQHVLPRGFKKVRHYGLMSSKHKQTRARIKLIFGEVQTISASESTIKTPYRPQCPKCKHEMVFMMRLAPIHFHARASPDKIL